MNTCPFCCSELYMISDVTGQCEFCGYEGEASKDGQRVYVARKFIQLEDAEQPYFKLDEYHTADLILLLSYTRKERSNQYNLLRTFNNAMDQGAEEFQSVANEQGGSYDYWTRRCWVIENIIKKRMGYFPEKISDDLYSSLERKCDRAEKKRMKISKQRKSKTEV